MKNNQSKFAIELDLSPRIHFGVTLTFIVFVMLAGYRGLAQTRTVPELNGDRYMNAADHSEYFIDQGLRRPVTALANSQLFGNNAWRTDKVGLNTVATGSLLDDAYLSRDNSGTVYLMDHLPDGWQKRPITALGMNTCGFNASLVKSGQQSLIDQASLGETINYKAHPALRIAPELNGGRYMDSVDRTAYFIDGGLRRPITAQANDNLFGNNAWRSDNVNLNFILVGDLLDDDVYLAKPDGGPNQSTVFLMDHLPDGWQKRPITALGFGGSGFDPAKIQVISQDVFIKASNGDTIDYKGPPPMHLPVPGQPRQPVQPPAGNPPEVGGQEPIYLQHCTVTVPQPSVPVTCSPGLTVQAACHSCQTAEHHVSCGGVRCESSYAVCQVAIPVSQSCPN